MAFRRLSSHTASRRDFFDDYWLPALLTPRRIAASTHITTKRDRRLIYRHHQLMLDIARRSARGALPAIGFDRRFQKYRRLVSYAARYLSLRISRNFFARLIITFRV